MSGGPKATFDPDYYAVRSFDQAMRETVGGLGFTDSVIEAEDRWVWDTPYTLDEIAQRFPLTADSAVLDYGCGTGRISKGLIERFGCSVTGVDESPSMREVARKHVANPDRFDVLSPLHVQGIHDCFDYAMCLWVLQHAEKPGEDVSRIYALLKPGGELLVFNTRIRHIPTLEFGFVHDGVDVRTCLAARFGAPVFDGILDPSRTPSGFAATSYLAVYRKAA